MHPRSRHTRLAPAAGPRATEPRRALRPRPAAAVPRSISPRLHTTDRWPHTHATSRCFTPRSSQTLIPSLYQLPRSRTYLMLRIYDLRIGATLRHPVTASANATELVEVYECATIGREATVFKCIVTTFRLVPCKPIRLFFVR